MGGRVAGLGYASSCLADEWSILNNVAGLAKANKTATAFSYDLQPAFKPFNRMAGVLTLPFNFGTAGAGVFRFGDELYSEQMISVGFANTFGLASLGLKANYIQYNAEGFGTKGVFTISFGGIAQLTEKISVGAHVVNLNQPTISKTDGEKLPTILIVGGSVKLSTQTIVTTELEKSLEHPVKWKTGVEYQLRKKFLLRTGFNINPGAAFFGFGFRQKKFQFDYAYQHSFTAGSRHQATIGFIFKEKK